MKSNIYRLIYEISLTLKFNICLKKKESIHRGIIELYFTVVFDKMKMPWMYYENKLKK